MTFEPKVVAQAAGTFITGVVGVLALASIDIDVTPDDVTEFVVTATALLAAAQTAVGFAVGWWKRSRFSRTSTGFVSPAGNGEKHIPYIPGDAA